METKSVLLTVAVVLVVVIVLARCNDTKLYKDTKKSLSKIGKETDKGIDRVTDDIVGK